MWAGRHLLRIAKNDKHPEYKRWSVEQKKKRFMSAAAPPKKVLVHIQFNPSSEPTVCLCVGYFSVFEFGTQTLPAGGSESYFYPVSRVCSD